MTTQTSIIAQQTRLRQWAEQIRECRNRPAGMDIQTWCSQNNITKANYYYRLRRVREACLDQLQESTPAFVEISQTSPATVPAVETTPVRPVSASHPPVARLHGAHGISVDIYPGISGDMLRLLMEAVAHVE